MFNPGLMVQQGPNPGERFASAFKEGQATAQQNKAKAAMAALARDPTNVGALAALAETNPEMALKYREHQAELAKTQHSEWTKTAAHAAKAATTPEAWDATIDQFVAAGHPEAAKLKGQFSPTLRAFYMAQGGLSDDAQHGHGAIPEYEDAKAKGLIGAQTTFEQFLQMKNPGMLAPVTIPANATVTVPGQSGSIPQVTDEASYNAVPPGAQYRTPDGHIRVKGGQSPQGSGGFHQN